MTVEGHDKFYIGSTIKTLSQRLSVHKNHYVNQKANYTSAFILFKYAKENGLDVKIELLEAYPCKNKLELHQREGWYMELHKDKIVNRYRAGVDYRNNENHRKEYITKYRKNDTVKILAQRKKYYSKHRVEIILNIRNYQLKNKAELQQKFNCECGGRYSKCQKSRHIETIKHQKFIVHNIF